MKTKTDYYDSREIEAMAEFFRAARETSDNMSDEEIDRFLEVLEDD